MDTPNNILLTLGMLFLVGFFCNELGRRTHIPRVTLLLLVGALASPNALNLVPYEVHTLFPYVSQIALCMVGFLLGEQFVYEQFIQSGKIVWSITLLEAPLTATVVFLALYLLNVPLVLALLLAGISPSTAPAATIDIIREGGFKGQLPTVLLEVVAIDDIVGIILFAVFLALAQQASGSVVGQEFTTTAQEILGAIVIGGVLGWPMAKLTGRLSKGEPTLVEALGFVLLCGGLAQLLHASYLLACITMGITVANFAAHHERPFHAIEGISTPLLIIFFLMAGFEFDLDTIGLLGSIGLIYIISRSCGKVAGGYLGARLAGAKPELARSIGWCLLPQAGVALGLSLLAAQTFPEYATQILSLLVGSTIVFELIGPVITRYTLNRADHE